MLYALAVMRSIVAGSFRSGTRSSGIHRRAFALAQLIFNAHDVNVLGDSEDEVLGRDQIWFAEKDHEGATSIYPLADFRPRRDEALGRRYLQGRFGAVPAVDPGELRVGLDLVDT